MIERICHHPDVYLDHCEWGLGVFAAKNIKKGVVVEESPFLVLGPDDYGGIVVDYVFAASDDSDDSYFMLGWGSLFNHADNHNITYHLDEERNIVIFETCKNVKKGTQLCVNYGKEWWDGRDITKDQPRDGS